MNERTQKLTSAAGVISWTVKPWDDAAVSVLALNVGVAPTTAGNVTIKIKQTGDATIDSIIRTIDAVGSTDIVVENLPAIDGSEGFYWLVEYANADSRTISGFAVISL